MLVEKKETIREIIVYYNCGTKLLEDFSMEHFVLWIFCALDIFLYTCVFTFKHFFAILDAVNASKSNETILQSVE